ncbi:unnamed protein product [Heligmosomoides polygyrus]|uniref:DDE_Tnp_1_7 domain-containing protein n=1 Tax=Heligmosomoides polygyrus TaxID=6339 RepID=A0A183G8T2_HELPZ|nr:unnamed protein product [Heligmosomoides polygyrus]
MSLLYEDEFVSVNECALNIKNFHFPSKKTKHVPIQAITVLWFEEQDSGKCAAKVWGKSQATIYWALDVKRYFRCIPGVARDTFNVVLDVGQKVRPGFSVANCESFMEAMRSVLDYHVIIVDNINL